MGILCSINTHSFKDKKYNNKLFFCLKNKQVMIHFQKKLMNFYALSGAKLRFKDPNCPKDQFQSKSTLVEIYESQNSKSIAAIGVFQIFK